MPPPRHAGGGKTARSYDWEVMEPGDSFLVADKPWYTVAAAVTSRNRRIDEQRLAARPLWTWRMRTLELHGEVGVRVWRMR